LAAHSANRAANMPGMGVKNEYECFISDWKTHFRDAPGKAGAVVIALKPSASVTMN
jgi:hypothetical protein